MNKNYLRGRRFEYAAKKYLEDKGWIVMRTAGSHGPFDIIAIKDGRILLLQLKKWQRLSKKQEIFEFLKIISLPIKPKLDVTVGLILNMEGLKNVEEAKKAM